MQADAERLAVIKGTQASAGALTLESPTALEEILLWLSWLRSEGHLRDPLSRQEMARLRSSLERTSAPVPAPALEDDRSRKAQELRCEAAVLRMRARLLRRKSAVVLSKSEAVTAETHHALMGPRVSVLQGGAAAV
jgi:hypothetical protein